MNNLSNWQQLKKDPILFKTFLVREQVNQAIREFFTTKRFHEVEVPLLAPSLPAESYVEIFETKLLDRLRRPQNAYLTTSPEMYLKKLLVAGIGNCFCLTKSFRNTEDMSFLHNPEFSILEWYRGDADYRDVMKDTEELFVAIYKKLFPERSRRETSEKRKSSTLTKGRLSFGQSSGSNLALTYQGQTIDLSPPWERLSMVEAFQKYAKLDLEKALDLESIAPIAKTKGYEVGEQTTWEELFHQIYLNEVEPHFGRGKPTIIYDFPSQMAALAKKKDTDPRFAERFEVYIAGLELGDCYSELTDWQEQEERFKAETEERKRIEKTAYPYDVDFIEALKMGLPRCAGLAMGIDRVVMLFADTDKIQNVLFFPASEMWRR